MVDVFKTRRNESILLKEKGWEEWRERKEVNGKLKLASIPVLNCRDDKISPLHLR